MCMFFYLFLVSFLSGRIFWNFGCGAVWLRCLGSHSRIKLGTSPCVLMLGAHCGDEFLCVYVFFIFLVSFLSGHIFWNFGCGAVWLRCLGSHSQIKLGTSSCILVLGARCDGLTYPVT